MFGHDIVAEWSKALDLGSSLRWRGFKSHRCQIYASQCVIHLPCCILFSRPLLRGQFKTQTKVNLRYLHLTRQTNTYTYQGWHTHTHTNPFYSYFKTTQDINTHISTVYLPLESHIHFIHHIQIFMAKL